MRQMKVNLKDKTLPAPTDGAKHTYKIYAVDSWDEESTNCITIEA